MEVEANNCKVTFREFGKGSFYFISPSETVLVLFENRLELYKSDGSVVTVRLPDELRDIEVIPFSCDDKTVLLRPEFDLDFVWITRVRGDELEILHRLRNVTSYSCVGKSILLARGNKLYIFNENEVKSLQLRRNVRKVFSSYTEDWFPVLLDKLYVYDVKRRKLVLVRGKGKQYTSIHVIPASHNAFLVKQRLNDTTNVIETYTYVDGTVEKILHFETPNIDTYIYAQPFGITTFVSTTFGRRKFAVKLLPEGIELVRVTHERAFALDLPDPYTRDVVYIVNDPKKSYIVSLKKCCLFCS